MAGRNGLPSRRRIHVVLVPGFGGFDALGQVEYYAGITPLFQPWKDGRAPLVLHYFDNFPTAGVATRANRLGRYLAKRVARGEILGDDRIVLVGHSTGGLDIRRLIRDMESLRREGRMVPADSGETVEPARILDSIDGVVFLSVPHWGTNIANFVRQHAILRAIVVAELRAAAAGSQLYLLDRIESFLTGRAGYFTDADLLLAVEDALTEANARFGPGNPVRVAAAEEAASQLNLWLRYMASDFHAIDDLAWRPPGARGRDETEQSPAMFNRRQRTDEFEDWLARPGIRVLSYATVSGRPFRFASGRPAPALNFANPCTYPEIERDPSLSAGTDFLYRLCYRGCAGGPFEWPEEAGEIHRVLGPDPPEPVELWDNDGIVNTASMLWPIGENVLVLADHLDIVGHFRLVDAPPEDGLEAGREPSRRFLAYNSFRSQSHFDPATFEAVWSEIFDFAAGRTNYARSRQRARPVKTAFRAAVPA